MVKPFTHVEACEAERLTVQTQDLEVWGSFRPGLMYVVSFDKELYFTFSLFTQVHKWVPAT